MLIIAERKMKMGMYKLLSGISLLARIYLCYVTIDTIPIFENELVNYMILEILSLYTIFVGDVEELYTIVNCKYRNKPTKTKIEVI